MMLRTGACVMAQAALSAAAAPPLAVSHRAGSAQLRYSGMPATLCAAARQLRRHPFMAAIHSQSRTASTAPGTPLTAQQSHTDLDAAEDTLRHLRQDVQDFSGASSHASIGPPPASMEDTDGASPAAADGEATAEAAPWPEPSLTDLDRSIPQVDSEFIASLIRSRNLRRDDFLRQKNAVKARVEELTRGSASTVADATRLPLVGGLGVGWLTNLMQGGGGTAESGLVAANAAAPVVASAEVLAQLTPEESNLLHTTRPEYDDGFVLIDCRTVNEVTSWGIIEGAKVLPAHELFEAFHSTPEAFLLDYGFAKPRPDDIIVCYCQYGPRSLMAAQILSWMGYLKVLHYRDGYYEWGKQYNLLLRRWMEHDKESGNELRRLATFRAGLEMQREIAPEFNALPMQEAQQYLRDTTRSPGTLLVGEGLRVEAYAMVAKLTEDLAPPALPGVLDANTNVLEGGADGKSLRGVGTQQVVQFLAEATGLDPQAEMHRPPTSMSIGEAQAVVVESLRSGAELGASPDAVTSPLNPRARPN